MDGLVGWMGGWLDDGWVDDGLDECTSGWIHFGAT